MKLGNIIKDYRQKNRLSQRQFALRCDVSNGYISMLEEGKNPKTNEPIVPSMATMKKLASAMGMTLNDLLSLADDMEIEWNIKANAPGLTEGEQMLIDLFRQIPEERQEYVLDLIRTAIKIQG